MIRAVACLVGCLCLPLCSIAAPIRGSFSFTLRNATSVDEKALFETYGISEGEILSGEFLYQSDAEPINFPDWDPFTAPDVASYRTEYLSLFSANGRLLFLEESPPVHLVLPGNGGGGALGDWFFIGDLVGPPLTFGMFDSGGPGRLFNSRSRNLPTRPSDMNTEWPFEVRLQNHSLVSKRLSFTLTIVPEPSAFALIYWMVFGILSIGRRRQH